MTRRLYISTLIVLALFSCLVHADASATYKSQETKTLNKNQPASSDYKQETEAGTNESIPSAYNHPAAIDLSGGYDVFVTAAFTYWEIQQEGMKIGSAYQAPISSGPNGFSDVLFIDEDFKIGFEVGLGVNTHFDDWVLTANYTNFHHTLTRNQGSFPFLSTPFILVGSGGGGVVFTNSSHRWTFGLDVIDLDMGRSFYQGKRLTVNPFFGLRYQSIGQDYHLSGVTTLEQTATGSWKTSSWGLGPRFGVDTNWLLGSGFRLIGSASGAVLFTDYSPLRYHEPSTASSYTLNIRSKDYLREDIEGSLGFGWGMYSKQQRLHIDFTATYDFKIFFNQNMIAWMMNNVNEVDSSPGNLYLNGLTVTGRFDF